MSRRKRRKWLGKIVRITDENCDAFGEICKVIETDDSDMAILQFKDYDDENWYYYWQFAPVDGNNN